MQILNKGAVPGNRGGQTGTKEQERLIWELPLCSKEGCQSPPFPEDSWLHA